MKIRRKNMNWIIISIFFGFTLFNIYNSVGLRREHFQQIEELFVPKIFSADSIEMSKGLFRPVKMQNISTYIAITKPMKIKNVSMLTRRNKVFNHENKTQTVLVAAVILLRIYETDKAKWTRLELKQWIEYMLYAGVGRVYLYDNYKYNNESLRTWCVANFPDIVIYHDWHKFTPYDVVRTQVSAYTHALNTYKHVSTWQIAFDMDEYPFMFKDMERDFLERFIKRKMKSHPNVIEWSLKNFLFLGKPLNARHILKRYFRRTPKPANGLDKPIYRTRYIKSCGIHHNNLEQGESIDANPNEIRMNHYWGARLQNWGDDTKEVLAMTIPDNSMLGLVEKMEKYFKDKFM